MHPTPTIIIANGQFPTHEMSLSFLQKADFIVCCDGAANDFIAQGGKPDAIVGDCDSISDENRNRFATIIVENNCPNCNDLTKAVAFCVEQGRTNIVILGGTGKREDHTLGNISLLAEYIEIAEVKMITNYGIFTPINADASFDSFAGQQVSIFSIDSEAVTSHNLKYPLHNVVLSNWWQGTLNESCGDFFSIKSGGRVVVFQAF